MRTVVFASQKGGVGKTTLSAHLAVEATAAGARCALADTDPQGSLTAWWNTRAAELPMFVQASSKTLSKVMGELKRAGIEYLFIDTPPALSDSIRSVCTLADLVLVPVRPSPHDLRAVAATVDLIEPLGKPLCFIVNSATKQARITGEAAIALSQHGTVSPVVVHHRVNFASSMIDGRTVQELEPKSPSSTEIKELWVYVMTRLRKPAKLPA
jgi:chromosome partitioning protein